MRVIDVSQRSPEWHQWRKGGVTASSAAIILGRSPYKTPWRLWAELRGEMPAADLSNNPHVKHGVILEPYARAWFEDEYDCLALPLCAESSTESTIRCSFDGVLEANDVLEIKCPSTASFLDVLENGTKCEAYQLYFPQVQHQLYVSGGQKGFLVFYHTRFTPVVFEIARDDNFLSELITAELAFWEMVVSGTEPPKDIERDAFRPDEELRLFWGVRAEHLRSVERQLDEHLKSVELLKKERDRYRDELVSKMGDFQQAEAEGVRINRFVAKGTIDWKSVAEKLDPDFSEEKYEQYRRKSSARINMAVDTGAECKLVSMDEVLAAIGEEAVWF